MGYQGSDKHKIKLWELFTKKQDKLTAGENVSLTPLQDGTVRIDAEGGGGTGTVTDVLVDGVSVVNQDGEAEITMPSDFVGATSQQAGSAGLVPAPSVADKDKVLKGDGTWGEAGGGNVDDVQVNGITVVDANKVAQVTSYKEITQAEYDALPESKLTDGILYCITDADPEMVTGFSPVIYSLEEREIGTWTDGRPLYQKTLQFTLDSTTIGNYVSFNHGINDINQIVGVDSFVTNDDGTYYDSVRFSSYDSGSSSVNAWYSASLVAVAKTSIGYQIGRYMPDSYTKLIVTLKYTKTTDVPGSGNWTDEGVPTHHYSTDEKVVGTWINGKPLYEKTISCGALPSGSAQSGTTKDVLHNITGLGFVVSMIGSAQRASGINRIPLPFVGIEQNTNDNQVRVMVSDTVIRLSCSFDRSEFTESYVTLQYTKTTD